MEVGQVSRTGLGLILGGMLVVGLLVGGAMNQFGANADEAVTVVEDDAVVAEHIEEDSFAYDCDTNKKYGNSDGQLLRSEYIACMEAGITTPESEG